MAAPITPEEWLPILAKRLDERQPEIKRLRSYCNGKAPLPEMGRNLRKSWEAFQKKSRTNFGGLACQTVGSRIVPLGVRVGNADDNPLVVAARRVWRDNRMKVQIKDAVQDRLQTRYGYLVVGVDAEGRAVVTREKPEDFITVPDPLQPWRARAALKVWRDDIEGVDYALVWVAGQRQRFSRSSQVNGVTRAVAVEGWSLSGEPELFDGPPPVVSLERDEALVESHTDLIDRINLGKLQRLVTTAMQAFRQRAIRPKDKDSDGLPEFDADGNAIDWAKVLEPAPGALWDLPVPIDIWESQPTDIRPLLEGEKADARDFAAVLRLPIAVFTPEGANQTATGADVTKEGLVSTAEDEIDNIAPAIAVVIVHALRAEGHDLGDQTVEVQFEPAAMVSLAEKYAAAASAKGIGLASRTIKRDILGMSPEAIRQDESDGALDLLTLGLAGDGGSDDPSA